MTDLALIAIASSALTAAVLLVVFHFYLRSRRRQLARVRAWRSHWRAEARRLRADRPAVHRSLAEHARQATALTDEPIAYTLVHPADRTAYLPVFDGDAGQPVAEYVQLRDATRQVWQVNR